MLFMQTRTVNDSSYGNEILYCGYRYDGETALNTSVTVGTSGNYQVRNRYYSTMLGLFISRDPIGYKGGINLYEYVGDDPENATDPSGLLVDSPTTAIRKCMTRLTLPEKISCLKALVGIFGKDYDITGLKSSL
jgi:RHS repeat-associated protein